MVIGFLNQMKMKKIVLSTKQVKERIFIHNEHSNPSPETRKAILRNFILSRLFSATGNGTYNLKLGFCVLLCMCIYLMVETCRFPTQNYTFQQFRVCNGAGCLPVMPQYALCRRRHTSGSDGTLRG